MAAKTAVRANELEFKPVSNDLWADLEKLFGKHGAYSGCWCMWWRIKRSEFTKQHGDGNKKALKKIVDSGDVPGILAYYQGRPVAWCSVAPRDRFTVLDRSPKLKRVDDKPVWSIVCFFFEKTFRGLGMTRIMIDAAIDYAGQQGAKIIEAYPLDKKHSKHTALEAFTGFASTFKKAGFSEVIRRSAIRPILRYYIEG